MKRGKKKQNVSIWTKFENEEKICGKKLELTWYLIEVTT